MVWVRLADDFPHHPKILRAGPLAGWLWACGLAYANRYATDGFIPVEQVRLLGDVPEADQVAHRLVEAGLWEREGVGYRIHDYAAYQPSADEVKREREAAARRQAEYRKRRGMARDAARNADSDALVTRESQLPGPGPGPGPVNNHPSDGSAAAARTRAHESSEPTLPADAGHDQILDVPAPLAGFHAVLVGTQGYAPSPAFFEQITERYGSLDLRQEALKMQSWLADPASNRRQRGATTKFILGWLEREQSDNGHRPAPAPPKRTTSWAEIAPTMGGAAQRGGPRKELGNGR